MTTQTQTQVAATLGITGRQLWALSSNPQFPQPASGSDQTVVWNASDITTFATTWSATIANGWKVSPAALPTFNFTYAAAHSPGQYYTPAFSDPLFDI
jgi:predicted DNA-binding transcriptional regulator AlpA